MRQTGPVKAALLMALLIGAPACDSVTPTTPTPPVSGHVNESFVGTLEPGGSSFYSFTAPAAGAVSLTLLSVAVNGAEIGDQLIMGIGTPAGTDCVMQNSVTTSSGTSTQLSGSVTAGVYCARVSDAGTLSTRTSFAVNIARPQ